MTFSRPAVDEQYRRALPVLLAARAKHLEGTGPLDAIRWSTEVPIEWIYAQRAFEAANPLVDLARWAMHGGVLQSDGTRFFDRAIRLARRAFGHRGGWVVSDCVGVQPPSELRASNCEVAR